MPIVPTQPSLISTDVNTGVAQTSVTQAGLPGNALAQTVGNITNTAEDLSQKVAALEASSAVTAQTNADHLESEKYMALLSQSSKDGYVYNEDGSKKFNPNGQQRTITQEYRDWANDRFQKSSTTMPNRLAQSMYDQQGSKFYTEQIGNLYTQELTKRVSYAESLRKETLDTAANNLQTAPDEQKLYDLSRNINTAVAKDIFIRDPQTGALSGNIAPKAALEAQRKDNELLSKSHFDGLYNTALIGSNNPNMLGSRLDKIDQAFLQLGTRLQYQVNPKTKQIESADLVEGMTQLAYQRKMNGLPTADSMLDPSVHGDFIEKFLKLRESAASKDRSDFHVWFSNAVDAAQMNSLNKSQQAFMLDKIMNLRPEMATPAEKANYVSLLKQALSAGRVYSSGFATASRQEQDKMIQNQVTSSASPGKDVSIVPGGEFSGAGIIGQTAGSKAFGFYTNAQAEFNAKREADFAGFVLSDNRINTGEVTVARAEFSKIGIDPHNIPALAKKNAEFHDYYSTMKQMHSRAYPDGSFYRGGQLPQSAYQDMFAVIADRTTSADVVGINLTALMKMTGASPGKPNLWPEVVNQAVDYKLVSPAYRISGLFYGNDPGLRRTTALAESIKNAKATDDLWMQTYGSNSVNRATFDASVSSKVTPWATDFLKRLPGKLDHTEETGQIVSAISTYAKKLMTEDNGLSASGAVDQAFALFVGDHVTSVSGGSKFFGLTSAWDLNNYPASVNGMAVDKDAKQRLSDAISKAMNKDSLIKAGVQPPSGGPTDPISVGLALDKMYSSIQPRVDGTGANVTFWYPLYNKNMQIIGHEAVQVKNKRGRLVPYTVDATKAMFPNAILAPTPAEVQPITIQRKTRRR